MPGFFQAWCREHNIDPGFPCSTADEILSAAERLEPSAGLFMHALARINGRGLSTVIVAYDPEIIVLDGPVITAHSGLLVPAALTHIDRYLTLPEIVISPLRGDAPLLGVAAHVFASACPGWDFVPCSD
jgi:glucokinase